MQNYITINSINIPKGNFGFVLDKTGSIPLYQACLAAEGLLYLDPKKCVGTLRDALDGLAYHIETKRRCEADPRRNYDDVYKRVYDECKAFSQDNRLNTKNILRDYARSNQSAFDRSQIKKLMGDILKNEPGYRLGMGGLRLVPLPQQDGEEKKYTISIEGVSYNLYRYYSGGAHVGEEPIDFDKARRFLQIFHEYASIILQNEERYDAELERFGEMYQIPRVQCRKLGINVPAKQAIAVLETGSELEWHLIKTGGMNSGNAAIRDIEILNLLWKKNSSTPESIIRDKGKLGSGQNEKAVYAFPGRPYSLTPAFIQTLTEGEKTKIAFDLLNAVKSVHHFPKTIVLRGLNTENTIVCRTEYGVQAFIVAFETAKLTDGRVTVVKKVTNMLTDPEKAAFIAPEVKDKAEVTQAADIYSLGVVLRTIFTGDVFGTLDDALMNDLINSMTKNDPSGRPGLTVVENVLNRALRMKHMVAGASLKGSRGSQEDAFFVSGTELIQGDDTEVSVLGDDVVMAVFDGVGSAEDSAGLTEMLAGKLKEYFKDEKHIKKCDEKILEQLLLQMEKETVKYADAGNLGTAGCTAAICVIRGGTAYYANIGDSRIYLIADTAEMLSKDHRYSRGIHYKQGLYSYLGVSREGYEPEIEIGSRSLGADDKIIVCTDGLTDKVSVSALKEIVDKYEKPEEAVAALTNLVIAQQGTDNITVLLYERGIQK